MDLAAIDQVAGAVGVAVVVVIARTARVFFPGSQPITVLVGVGIVARGNDRGRRGGPWGFGTGTAHTGEGIFSFQALLGVFQVRKLGTAGIVLRRVGAQTFLEGIRHPIAVSILGALRGIVEPIRITVLVQGIRAAFPLAPRGKPVAIGVGIGIRRSTGLTARNSPPDPSRRVLPIRDTLGVGSIPGRIGAHEFLEGVGGSISILIAETFETIVLAVAVAVLVPRISPTVPLPPIGQTVTVLIVIRRTAEAGGSDKGGAQKYPALEEVEGKLGVG